MEKKDKREVHILYFNKSDFMIPYQEINGEKVLELNGKHSFLAGANSKYLDTALKVIYDLDTKKWSLRGHDKDYPFIYPEIESVLSEELKKYKVPEKVATDKTPKSSEGEPDGEAPQPE